MRTGSTAGRAAAAAVLGAAVLQSAACSSRAAAPARTGLGSTAAAAARSATALGADPAGAAAPCRTSWLRIARSGADVGAGQYFTRLVFTNAARRACTLTGYPGVSYVAAGGVRSGNAARRSPGRAVTVLLAPGGTASAVLHDSNGPGGYAPAQCRPALAEGLRVYPPGQRTALFLPWRTRHCAGPGVHSSAIGPVQR